MLETKPILWEKIKASISAIEQANIMKRVEDAGHEVFFLHLITLINSRMKKFGKL